MKRIIIALSLLLFVTLASVVTYFTAENAIDKTQKALNVCFDKEDDETLDALKLEKALKAWEYNKKYLFVITFHEDFSEIEKNMTDLKYLVKEPDFNESSKICYKISLMFDEMRKEFSVSFENIF